MNQLRILTANIAMGNPRADHPLEDVYGLMMFHNWRVIPFILFGGRLRSLFDYSLRPNRKRVPYFARVSDLRNILGLIRKEKPDLLVLNELFEQFHKDKVVAALQELGFQHFSWGVGSHHSDTTLLTLVASRLPVLADRLSLNFPQRKEIGGGGGATCLRLKNQPITLVGCHLASNIQDLSREQIKALADFGRQEQARGRQVVIAGDFNMPEAVIQSVEGFGSLRLKSTTDRPTCPVGVPKIFQSGFDHVFIPEGWQVRENKFPAFSSDHLAVSIEVVPISWPP